MYGFHSPKCKGCIPTQKWLNFLHNLPKMEGLHSPKWRGSIPIIWAGYSHYLGWVFLLPVPLQGAPCSPYRVLPVPPTGCSLSPLQGAPCRPTDWVVKRDFKSFWAKLSPLQGLPVPPTGCSLSPLQIGWLRGILNHFEPQLFPYSCPDCSPTVALTVPLQGAIWAGYSHYLGGIFLISGLDIDT